MVDSSVSVEASTLTSSGSRGVSGHLPVALASPFIFRLRIVHSFQQPKRILASLTPRDGQ